MRLARTNEKGHLGGRGRCRSPGVGLNLAGTPEAPGLSRSRCPGRRPDQLNWGCGPGIGTFFF